LTLDEQTRQVADEQSKYERYYESEGRVPHVRNAIQIEIRTVAGASEKKKKYNNPLDNLACIYMKRILLKWIKIIPSYKSENIQIIKFVENKFWKYLQQILLTECQQKYKESVNRI